MKDEIQQYKNLVELLKQALSYYADEEIYKDNDNNSIMLDKGHQARFALNQIGLIKKASNKTEDDYINDINQAIKTNKSYDEMLKIMRDYKKISESE